MRDVTGDFRAVPNGLFQKRIARIARNCPFRHHYFFFFQIGPRGPIWPSATSIQGFLPELGRFQAGVVRERGRVLDGVRWRK